MEGGNLGLDQVSHYVEWMTFRCCVAVTGLGVLWALGDIVVEWWCQVRAAPHTPQLLVSRARCCVCVTVCICMFCVLCCSVYNIVCSVCGGPLSHAVCCVYVVCPPGVQI